jgi:hypothetical protein
MSGAADDVSCVVIHDECPGLGATLCGSELFVVVFLLLLLLLLRVQITSMSPIWGEVSMVVVRLPPPTSLLVHLWIKLFH